MAVTWLNNIGGGFLYTARIPVGNFICNLRLSAYPLLLYKGDSMYNFLLGFISMAVVAMIVVSYNQTPEVETVCGKCGSLEWWFVLAEGEE